MDFDALPILGRRNPQLRPSAGSTFFFAAYFKLSMILERPRQKKIYVGEALAKFLLLTSIDETDSDSGVTYTKKQATRGNPLQDRGCLLQLVKLTLIL